MIWIDYTIIGIMVFSTLVSFLRGFLREVLSLITWGCAFFVASYYYKYLTIYLIHFKETMVRNSITIILLFIATLIIGALVNYVLSSLVECTGLSSTDRVLGICFGILRGILIVSVVLFFLDTFTGFSQSQDWQQSKIIPQFSIIIRWFFNYLQSTSSFLLKQYLPQ